MSRHPIRPCGVTYPHLAHVGTHGDGNPSRFARCRGVEIHPLSRAVPVQTRRDIVAELRSAKATVQQLVNRWAVDGMTYEGSEHRPRRLDEFPENNAARWRELARVSRHLAGMFNRLGSDAGRQAVEVDEFNARATERARRAGAVEL